MITLRVRQSLRSMVHKLISAELPSHDHSFIACSRHIYSNYGAALHAHPVRGESHNQRNNTEEVATVRKITASRENRGKLLGDQVMKTASHRNCTLQVALIEFEQLLQDRKWELVFSLQSNFVDFSHDH